MSEKLRNIGPKSMAWLRQTIPPNPRNQLRRCTSMGPAFQSVTSYVPKTSGKAQDILALIVGKKQPRGRLRRPS